MIYRRTLRSQKSSPTKPMKGFLLQIRKWKVTGGTSVLATVHKLILPPRLYSTEVAPTQKEYTVCLINPTFILLLLLLHEYFWQVTEQFFNFLPFLYLLHEMVQIVSKWKILNNCSLICGSREEIKSILFPL